MAGVKAGRLEIEIVAEIARLQQDLDRAKRAVKSASGDIARNMKAANDNTTFGLNKVGQAFDVVGRQSQAASRSIGMFGKALAAVGIGLSIREIGRMADEWSDMNSRLTNATGSVEKGAAAMDRLTEVARRSYSAVSQTTESFIQQSTALNALGVSMDTQLDLTEALNNALVISATRGQRAQSVMDAWAKSMALGKMQGDQLNTIISGSNRLAQALADSMGINVTQLRAYGAQGKITREVMLGITGQLAQLRKEAEEMPATLSDGLTLMKDGLLQLVGRLDQTLGISENIAKVMVLLADNLDAVAVAALAAGSAFAAMKLATAGAAAAAYIGRLIALEKALGATNALTALFGVGVKQVTAAFRLLTAAMMVNPFVLIAGAIAAVTALLYANRDSQVQVGEETVRLGDIFLGVWEVVKNAVAFVQTLFTEGWAAAFAKISPALVAVGHLFDQVFSFIAEKIAVVVNGAIGLLVGLGKATMAVFSGGDVAGAFREGFGQDYVGAIRKRVGDAVVGLAEMGRAAREAGASSAAASGGVQALSDTLDDNSKKARAARQELSELEKEMKRRNEETIRFIAALEEEIARIGLSEKALRQREIAQARENAVTAEQKKRIDALNAARERELGLLERRNRLEAARGGTQAIADSLAALERETQVLEDSGWLRDRRLKQLEREAEIGPRLVAQWMALAAGDAALAEELQKQIDLLNEKYALEIQNGDRLEAIRKEEEALQRVNDQLRDMVDLLDSVGGAGQVLGSLLAVATGDFRGVASGPAGDILSYVLNQPTGNMIERNGQKVAEVLGHKLEDVFGSQGIFGKTLVEALQAAGLGYAAANAMGVGSGAASGFLSSAGGLFGEIAGEKLLGKLLGSFAGPVGSILGGIAGGLIGSLFGGADKGVIGISGSAGGLTTFGTKHNSAEQLAAATQAASGMIDALGKIAQELGGTMNAGAAGRLTLGMRDDDWVLDPTGQGRTKGAGVINFGPDQEAAVKAAMKLLIDRGVIGGIRESTMNLLKNAGDLEQGLADALAFEGVFAALEAQANPFAAAMKQLGREMAELEAIFQRAGATAEEYGQLQQFIAMQQQALIDQASANYRSTFYSDAENVAFARQTISSTLTPMGHGNVDTVAEYKALVEATDALADPELYGALMELSDEFGVLKDAADQAKAAAAAEAEQKKAQAAAERSERENMLRQAWQRERGELERVADAYRQHATRMRDWRRELMAGADATTGYAQRLAHLRRTFDMARLGDEKALGNLPGAGNDFLSAARSRAGSLVEYQQAVSMVARMAEDAARSADGMATEAEKQIARLDEMVGKLIDIDKGVMSVAEAIKALGGGGSGGAGRERPAWVNDLLENRGNWRQRGRDWRDYEGGGVPEFGSLRMGGSREQAAGNGVQLAGAIDTLRAELSEQNKTLKRIDERWERNTSNDGVGFIVRNDPDIPLNTQATS